MPDDRILKSEAETGCLCMCLCSSILDMVEMERSFPVKGDTQAHRGAYVTIYIIFKSKNKIE